MNKQQTVKEMRLSGMTYKEIAKELGISTAYVHQLYKNYKPLSLKVRNKILERDFYKCILCKNSCKLEIHHIDGNTHNNNQENLQTLCKPCHSKTDAIQRKETRDAERKWINDNWHLKH